MKLPTLDGWLSWSFDDIAYSQRTDKNSVYKFQVNKRLTLPVESYYKEIYNNARHMRDYYSGTFDVLLSGGIDSEVVVRTFKDLGIKHNTFIFNQRKIRSSPDQIPGTTVTEPKLLHFMGIFYLAYW